VGLTGCGNGAVFLDRRSRPLGAGILSSDTRADPHMGRASPETGQQSYAGQLPALLAWLRAVEPARARRLAHALFWKDFVRAKLTDVVASDYTDAGAAGLLAFPDRRLRRPDPTIPDLNESLTQAGEITRRAASATGLRTGTAVFTGCIDCEAAAIGSGVYAPGEVSVVAGTWSINQSYVSVPPLGAGHFLVNPSVERGRWLVLEGSPTSAANFEWAVRTWGGASGAAGAARLAARARRSNLLFVPRVPTGDGTFHGLGPADAWPELLHAVMAGVVHGHREHIDALAVTIGKVRRVTLVGGATRSPFWCQLFADGLGCEVAVPRGEQIGALGAAIVAGVGAGWWPSIPEAQEAMVPPCRRFSPDPKRKAEFLSKHARYQSFVSQLPR